MGNCAVGKCVHRESRRYAKKILRLTRRMDYWNEKDPGNVGLSYADLEASGHGTAISPTMPKAVSQGRQRSASQGRATYSMEPDRYERVPRDKQEELLK